MNAIKNFAFNENLVRIVERDEEPWFVGKDVCAALGLSGSAPNHLRNLDEDERGMFTIHTPGGAQEVTIISEAGVYRLVFRSRKPEAEKFKRWLAHEVLPVIRKTGRYEAGAVEQPSTFEIDIQHAPLSAKLQYLRMVQRYRGREAAVAMMPHIGMPDIDAVLYGGSSPAQSADCLAVILNHQDECGETVRDMLGAVGKGEARPRLRHLGIFVEDDVAGFAVAINPRCTEALFSDTEWTKGRHVIALRGVSGSYTTRKIKFSGQIVSAAIFIPISAI